jgi:hypothetical protein
MKSFVCLFGLSMFALANAFPAETAANSEAIVVNSDKLDSELSPIIQAVVNGVHENEAARNKRFIGIGIGGLGGGYGGYGGYGGGYGGGYPGKLFCMGIPEYFAELRAKFRVWYHIVYSQSNFCK